MQDGSGAKPLMIGLWYDLSVERESDTSELARLSAPAEVQNVVGKMANANSATERSIVQVEGFKLSSFKSLMAATDWPYTSN
jgi:hypothetical protein